MAFVWLWCGVSLADERPEPRAFVADSGSRSISDPQSASPLRWRSKPRAGDGVEYESDRSAAPDSEYSRAVGSRSSPSPLRAGWNVTRIDPSVRPAQAISDSPFNDPFGDRRADAPAARLAGPSVSPASNNARQAAATDREPLILQPTNAEGGIEELPAPRPLPPTRRPTRPAPMLTAQQPGLGDRSVLPGPRETAPPLAGSSAERSSQPCDRVYNDRDCCDQLSKCNDFRDRLLSDSIRNISLDITAPFDKDPDKTVDQNEADRIDKFRLLEQRVWRDRRGNTIATGKLDNILNNAIVLVDESGREVRRVQINELGEGDLCYVTAWWRLPSECPLGGIRRSERNWLASTFYWHASALCHKPLYFEDVQLERYGHTAGPFRQPLFSGAHFFVSLAGLPYQMAINPPGECQYSLGYYRPGSCAPWMIQPFPLSVRGAAAEIGVALGLAYVLP